MRIQPIPYDIRDLQIRIDEGRSDEVHCGQIIQSILRHKDDKYKKEAGEVGETVRALWEVGFIWEQVAGKAMADRYKLAYPSPSFLTQCEIVEMGPRGRKIVLTPDLINLCDECIDEFKATKISANNPIGGGRFRHWFWQMKAYCRAARYNKARLHVLFINGVYEKVVFGDVMPRAWEIEFTRIELEENWRMLMNHLEWMVKTGEIKA